VRLFARIAVDMEMAVNDSWLMGSGSGVQEFCKVGILAMAMVTWAILSNNLLPFLKEYTTLQKLPRSPASTQTQAQALYPPLEACKSLRT